MSSLGRTDEIPPIVPMQGQVEERYSVVEGKLGGAEHEIEDGYFSVAGAAFIRVVPETPAWYRLKELQGRVVRVVIEPVQPKVLKKLDR